MLVLTRRPNERFTIGDKITITILEASANRVRIGIEAPPEIAIHREDIIDKRQEDRQ